MVLNGECFEREVKGTFVVLNGECFEGKIKGHIIFLTNKSLVNYR